MSQFKLYSYFRSSASYRVRAALNYKGLEYEYHPIHLVKDGGEQFSEEYKKLNPLGEVPCLIHNNRALGQSMAIMQYLEEVAPNPPLFPNDSWEKAKVIQLCEAVNSGIQPIQNLKVLFELDRRFQVGAEGKAEWAAYWIDRGFQGLEKLLETTAGNFAFADQLTAADLYIVPQVYNAHRFKVDMAQFPIISRLAKNANTIDAVKNASPESQPDFPGE